MLQAALRRKTAGFKASIRHPLLLTGFLSLILTSHNTLSENDEYRTIEWIDLIPEADLQALMNPPDIIGAIIEGAADDQIGGASEPLNYGENEEAQRYEAALQSTTVKPEFDGVRVRIPGFVVPLDFDETRMVDAFFLVPYFGACLHNPPPPPNQIIYSEFEGGLSLDDIYDPFWLEGTLHVETKTSELGVAAYRMETERVTRYDWNED